MSELKTHAAFDAAKAEAFARHFVTVLNHGALCLMVSVGHRTGLFDVLRQLPPATSQEIATQAGLHERYVREWLGAMVTAGVMEVDLATTRFVLPAEHAAWLTRAAAADNLAVLAQYLAVLGGVEDNIVECFQQGGGVPYDNYPRFHAVMAEDSGQSVLSSLESHILPLVPGLSDRLAAGIRVLDVGCGRGRIMNHVAGLYPYSQFTGLDLSPEAIAFARHEAMEKGLQNSEFVVVDVSDFYTTAPSETFDCITTFDAVHDQARPLNVLQGIHRALRADGVYLMQDIKGSSQVQLKTMLSCLGVILVCITAASRTDSSWEPTSLDEVSADVAVAWFDLLYELVKAEQVAPPPASRIYGVAAVALYEAIVEGSPESVSLVGQLNDLETLPQAAPHRRYDWPAVANSALARVVRGLFPSPSSVWRHSLSVRQQQRAGARPVYWPGAPRSGAIHAGKHC